MAIYTISYNETDTYWYYNEAVGAWVSYTETANGPVIGPFSESSDGGPDNSVWTNAVPSGDTVTGELHSATTAYGQEDLSVYGSAAAVTIDSYGDLVVEDGGVANGTTVDATGLIYVQSGGSAFATTIDSGGDLMVEGGGVASGVAVEGRGSELELDSGGSAFAATLGSGAALFVESGALVSDVTVDSGAWLTVESGGSAFDATVAQGGGLDLNAGFVADSQTISAAESVEVADRLTLDDYIVGDGQSWTVFDGGEVSGVTVASGGLVEVDSGGSASRTLVESGGQLELYAGFDADAQTLDAATYVEIGSGFAYSSNTVNSGAEWEILSGGSVSDMTVNSDGNLKIDSGGEASGDVVNGDETVNGSATGESISLYLYVEGSAAIATDTNVNGGGMVYVGEGGNVAGTILSGLDLFEESQLYIQSGGKASGTHVKQYSSEILESGAISINTVIDNALPDYSNFVGQFIEDGGEAIGDVIDVGAEVFSYRGGNTSDTAVGGELFVEGATDTDSVIEDGGVETVYGVAEDATILDGGLLSVCAGSAFVDPDGLPIFAAGSAIDAVIYGDEVVSSLANDVGATVESGGVQSVWGVADLAVVSAGGRQTVYEGAATSGALVFGDQVISAGGEDSGAAISSGGVQTLFGAAADATVFAGGVESVASGGQVADAHLDGGAIELQKGGAATGGLTFVEGSQSTLEIDGATMPSAVISGFASGDVIDLAGVAFDPKGTASLSEGDVLQVVENGAAHDLQFDASAAALPGFSLAADGAGGTNVAVASPLFTSGADTVDFNALTPAQAAVIAAGEDVDHGLGGDDVVTLPSLDNFNEVVGGGKTLGWTDTSASTFFTGSRDGDTYRISGSDGDYFISEGAGSEFVTIDGDGDSTITAGSGDDTISFAGDGEYSVVAGSGPEDITFTGAGLDDFTGGDGAYAINVSGGYLTVDGALAEASPAAILLASGGQLDALDAYSGDLDLPNGGSFFVDAPDGLAVGYQKSDGETPDLTIGLAGSTSGVVSIEDAVVTYSATGFTISGTVYAALGGVDEPLFEGKFTLPYNSPTTTDLTDDKALAGKFDLGGLTVTFEQLTLEQDALLAGFSLSLPFPGGSLTLDTKSLGINDGLSFGSSGPQFLLGASVTFPDSGPVNVFGIFTGSISNASLSYLAASDTLQLQGTFTATQILGTAIQATANFSGANFIQYQSGTAYFAGSLTITGFSTPSVAGKAAFGIKEIDLSVNTRAQTFSGGVVFMLPFGVSAPEADVSLKGAWSNGPVITEVDVKASNLGIVVPGTPDVVWQSASLAVANMFVDASPTTFSGSLGFSFGPTLLSKNIGALTLSGSASSVQITATDQIQIVPYSLVSGIDGGALSGFQSIFPFLSETGTVTANFGAGGSGFQNFAFSGALSVFGSFLTINQTFRADSNLDITLSGSAAVNFGVGPLGKLDNLGTVSANYLVSYTNGAPLSADFAEAWATRTISFSVLTESLTVGVKVEFNGVTSLIFGAPSTASGAAEPTPASALSTAAAVSLSASSLEAASAPTENLLFITVNWTNAASGPVALTVENPSGTAIGQASFVANNITVVSALSTAYSETVAILDPGAATGWSAGVVDSTGLGTVTTSVASPDAGPGLQSLSVAGAQSRSEIAVDYDLSDTSGDSTLSVYADQDGQHFDGVLLGSSSAIKDGSGSMSVSLNDLNDGVWHIYALVSDGIAVPQEIYATSTLTVADSILTQTNADGSRIVSTFTIAGEPWTSTVATYNSTGRVTSETFYNSGGGVVYEYVLSASIAAFDSFAAELNTVPAGFAISDTAANLMAAVAAVTADASHIASITASDGRPVTVGNGVFAADEAALDEIAGGFSISGRASVLNGNLSGLEADQAHINAVTAAGGAINATIAQFAADEPILNKVSGGFVVSDTATAIAAWLTASGPVPSALALDAGHLASITASGGTVTIGDGVFAADRAALDEIAGGFAVSGKASVLNGNLSGLEADQAHINSVTAAGGAINATIAQFSADEPILNKVSGGFVVSDTATTIAATLTASVTAGMAPLAADASHITSITASGGTVTVGNGVFAADRAALDKIAGGFAVSGKASVLNGDLAGLEADQSHIDSVTATGGPIMATIAQFAADQPILDKVAGGFSVADTAAAIAAALTASVAAGVSPLAADASHITSITASGGTVTVGNGVFTADRAALDAIAGGFAISGKAGVLDGNLDGLQNDVGHILSIAGTGGPITGAMANFRRDETAMNKIAGGFDISDTAANIVAGLGLLQGDVGAIDAITLTDATKPTITLTSALYNADKAVLAKIASPFALHVT